MKIVTLMENGKLDMKGLQCEHGVSLYIEAHNHKILLDVGTSKKFLLNAKLLNVDISEVDTVVISHGHYDHGGGLKWFLENNNKAKIYLKKSAFEKHFASLWKFKFNVGLQEKLLQEYEHRFQFVEDTFEIASNIYILGKLPTVSSIPSTNKRLLMAKDGRLEEDNFNHEIYLLIRENNKVIAFSGCGHNGIINIIEGIKPLLREEDKLTVISGLHLKAASKRGKADIAVEVEQASRFLYEQSFLEKLYTGHCTGDEAYDKLKEVLGSRLDRFITGKIIEL